MAQIESSTSVESHDPVMNVIRPALKFGAFTGAGGFLVGGTAGILKSTTPKLFATVSGIQCFALGSTYWASRGFVLQAWDTGRQPLSSSDKIKAGSIAGGFTGGIIGALARGRSNVIPGAVIIAIVGGAGQAISNWWFDRPTNRVPTELKPSFWSRLIPMKHMTNAEYSEMLKNKLLKVDVEIAILDDKLAALKQKQSAGHVSESETTTDK